jgi:alkaline phosphatase
MYRSLIILIAVMGILSCKSVKKENPGSINSNGQKKAKNIILLIGDGMGMGQISAGTYVNNNRSALERFPVTGLHKPTCYDSLITDSAAGATAFACGQKTYYNAIGVDKDTMPLKTILEEAEEKGLLTGLVATSTIVHATPASFIAHNKYRRNYEEIAEDFLKTDIEYFVGGGKKYFDRREKDDRNLLDELREKGYFIGDYLLDFTDFKKKISDKERVAYLSSDKDPLPVSQGRDYLIDATITGIDFLDTRADEGFFMMIESSQIDWGGHANNEEYIISEFIEFSELLDKVLDWAARDGETLVIVTADHETGGFTIQPGSTFNELKTAFTSKKHSGDFIPVFAYGPSSLLFSGIYENFQIYHKMRAAFQWEK